MLSFCYTKPIPMFLLSINSIFIQVKNTSYAHFPIIKTGYTLELNWTKRARIRTLIYENNKTKNITL